MLPGRNALRREKRSFHTGHKIVSSPPWRRERLKNARIESRSRGSAQDSDSDSYSTDEESVGVADSTEDIAVGRGATSPLNDKRGAYGIDSQSAEENVVEEKVAIVATPAAEPAALRSVATGEDRLPPRGDDESDSGILTPPSASGMSLEDLPIWQELQTAFESGTIHHRFCCPGFTGRDMIATIRCFSAEACVEFESKDQAIDVLIETMKEEAYKTAPLEKAAMEEIEETDLESQPDAEPTNHDQPATSSTDLSSRSRDDSHDHDKLFIAQDDVIQDRGDDVQETGSDIHQELADDVQKINYDVQEFGRVVQEMPSIEASQQLIIVADSERDSTQTFILLPQELVKTLPASSFQLVQAALEKLSAAWPIVVGGYKAFRFVANGVVSSTISTLEFCQKITRLATRICDETVHTVNDGYRFCQGIMNLVCNMRDEEHQSGELMVAPPPNQPSLPAVSGSELTPIHPTTVMDTSTLQPSTPVQSSKYQYHLTSDYRSTPPPPSYHSAPMQQPSPPQRRRVAHKLKSLLARRKASGLGEGAGHVRKRQDDDYNDNHETGPATKKQKTEGQQSLGGGLSAKPGVKRHDLATDVAGPMEGVTTTTAVVVASEQEASGVVSMSVDSANPQPANPQPINPPPFRMQRPNPQSFNPQLSTPQRYPTAGASGGALGSARNVVGRAPNGGIVMQSTETAKPQPAQSHGRKMAPLKRGKR